MKATELRLGNLIYVPTYSKEAVIVDAGFRLDRFFENFEPEGIPLTEEWLEKFGFERNDYSATRPHTYDEPFCIIELDSIGWHIKWAKDKNCWALFSRDNPYNYVPCKYVHSLQNLYFALTGKELTIKQMANESV